MARVRKNDKRDRLVEAADKLIYEQTFHTTTLADIAKEADVPLGNVYYYFKTKDAIMEAVLQKRSAEWRELFVQWEAMPEVRERLSALMHHMVDQSETLSRFGCIVGSLCQELGKQGGTIASGASKLMSGIMAWVKSQFELLGKGDEASTKLAEQLISRIQGASLLTLTFREPDYIRRQSQDMEQWLASL
jgi:TetR/AcrR family transcriptional regulator, transcriptional repressor for nem operon